MNRTPGNQPPVTLPGFGEVEIVPYFQVNGESFSCFPLIAATR